MNINRPRPGRHAEIAAILEAREGRVSPPRDIADKYTVLGAAGRETFANWLTPIEEHFVCHRNDMPDADADSWSVSLTGDLEGSLTMAELREEHPRVAVAHTMECAGNGRGQHEGKPGSVQWDCEAAATAVWTGTPVSSVLREHGLDAPDDRWLTAIGGDPSVAGDVFARSIPLSKALEDCILAYEMNGQPLPREHGFPVRLIVPGWYGVNNVKWVEELRLMDTMVTEGSLDRPGIHAHWQQATYRIHPPDVEPEESDTVETFDTWEGIEGAVEHPYTFDLNVMSLIGAPDGDAPVPPRSDGPLEIRGVAWAGDDAVERVEVSTDGGETWADAELFGPDYAGAWRLFRCEWDAEPGRHLLLSRATDELGRRQPERISSPEAWRDALEEDAFPWNGGGFAANAYRPNGVGVTVEARDGTDPSS